MGGGIEPPPISVTGDSSYAALMGAWASTVFSPPTFTLICTGLAFGLLGQAMRPCGYQGDPVGLAAQMSELPTWLPDQWKIDNQRKCRLGNPRGRAHEIKGI